jgi:hypothetical protein
MAGATSRRSRAPHAASHSRRLTHVTRRRTLTLGTTPPLSLFGSSEPVRIEFQRLHHEPTPVAEGAELCLHDSRVVEAH